MKVKENFILRSVADCYIVVPVGMASRSFNGMINLNKTGAFLWQSMEQDETQDDLVEALMIEYDIDKATATGDVEKFLAELRAADLIIE